jgi:transposase InsO family protein
VSNDNPYSESLFRTLKYRPEHPEHCFADLQGARTWVAGFVDWYNTQHLHSAIKLVTGQSKKRLLTGEGEKPDPLDW